MARNRNVLQLKMERKTVTRRGEEINKTRIFCVVRTNKLELVLETALEYAFVSRCGLLSEKDIVYLFQFSLINR